MATKAFAAFWFITSSTACMAPPAPRSAASKLPGDIEVSASMLHHAFLRRGVADRFDVFHRMAERDRLERRARRLFARQHLELLVLQRLLDGAHPVRPLGMAAAGSGDRGRPDG